MTSNMQAEYLSSIGYVAPQRDDVERRLDGLRWRTRIVALAAVGTLPFAWALCSLAMVLWHRGPFGGAALVDVPPDLMNGARAPSLHSLFWLLALVPLGLVLLQERSGKAWQRTIAALCVAAVVGVVALTKDMAYATRPLHLFKSQLERDIAAKQWDRVVPYLKSLANPVALPGDLVRFEREKSAGWLDDGDRAYLRMANEWAAAQYVLAQIGLHDADQRALLRAHGEQMLQATDNYFYSLGVDHADIGKLGARAFGNLRADVIARIDRELHGEPISAIGIAHLGAVRQTYNDAIPTDMPRSALWAALAAAIGCVSLLVFAVRLAWKMYDRSRTVAAYLL